MLLIVPFVPVSGMDQNLCAPLDRNSLSPQTKTAPRTKFAQGAGPGHPTKPFQTILRHVDDSLSIDGRVFAGSTVEEIGVSAAVHGVVVISGQ